MDRSWEKPSLTWVQWNGGLTIDHLSIHLQAPHHKAHKFSFSRRSQTWQTWPASWSPGFWEPCQQLSVPDLSAAWCLCSIYLYENCFLMTKHPEDWLNHNNMEQAHYDRTYVKIKQGTLLLMSTAEQKTQFGSFLLEEIQASCVNSFLSVCHPWCFIRSISSKAEHLWKRRNECECIICSYCRTVENQVSIWDGLLGQSGIPCRALAFIDW